MITNQRYEKIMDYLNERGTGSVNDLVDITNSSTATVRRDLTYLESRGMLKRVHGGATVEQMEREEDYTEKSVKNLSEKIKIAQIASEMIEDGDTVFIDAGTTTYEMMPFIKASDVTVVTNSITLIDQLVRNGHKTHVLGGRVKPATKAVVGHDVIEKLKTLSFDKCFVGVNAIDIHHGFTTPDEDEAHIKRTAVEQARRAFVLADSSKFERSAFVKFASLAEASIITENPDHPYLIRAGSGAEITGGKSNDLYSDV
ncbi:DeoR/GlpR family DNA-binding transcription regulator [Salinicoccus carnicancri]|uniref:DeoR/GlpR family DNA-binding transcription regulator n=1 Tax=Salinicoccus carnicancri TaxID=558170 RepID=UPI0002F623C1|nr:DeoR/GlpR family DNA-binding transcription regulator [Salinicoccus carnicancri]